MALNEARDKIAQLENAITRLDFVKKHLSRNASDIKKEIHSCVSRNLGCLRGREVSLLGQVDEVLSIKEDALHQQQARLNQALGVLQTGLTMMKDDSASEKQLRDTLEMLNRMELSPGETPHIAFRADHISLKESIMKYGRVDANGLSFAAFDDPDNPSASLPRHLEDYEDVDHHVFNKPVQQTAMSSITVTIPNISNRMEDWLQKRNPSKLSVDAPLLPLTKLTSSLSFQPATVKSSQESAKSNCSTPGDACSLNNWLSLIKNHSDLEEEHDFEIVDNSSSKEASEDETIDDRLPSDFFSHIEKDLKFWVSSTSSGTDVFKNDRNSFFRHTPTDAEFWLSEANEQLSALEETTETDFFKHISKRPSTWLRSRAYVKHQAAHNGDKKGYDDEAFKTTSKADLSKWLLNPDRAMIGKDKKDDNHKALKDQDKWLQKPVNSGCCTPHDFQLEEVCRANELCSSASDCISQPNCAIFCQQNSGLKNPIDPMSVFKPQQLPLDQWLLTSKGKEEDGLTDAIKARFVSSDAQKLFTLNSTSPGVTNLRSDNFKSNKEETNQWLRGSHVAVQEPIPQFDNISLVSTLSGSSLSDWLMSPTSTSVVDVKSKGREHEIEKECSEGWSLCSSPSSVNEDQFTKDVEIATDYMKQWIL